MHDHEYDLSIICCYTDERQIDELKQSLPSHNHQIELIELDNRNNRWASAAEAYIEGINLASAPLLLFSHQDIRFVGDSFIHEFIKEARSNPNSIIGVAGAAMDGNTKRTLLSSMYQGSIKNRFSSIDKPVSAITLDECLFGCHKNVFEKIAFDPITCDGWHFYAVDLTLQAQIAGVDVIVIPAEVIHISTGNRDKTYYLAQEKIKEKFRNHFEVIPMTCGTTNTKAIDPYRPVINDELEALVHYKIPYTINFERSLIDSFSLSNNDFLPLAKYINASKHVIASSFFDEKIINTLDFDRYAEAFDLIVALNNTIKMHRWVLEDTIRLHDKDYLSRIIRQYENSRTYILGTKLFPWSKKHIEDTLSEYLSGHIEVVNCKQPASSEFSAADFQSTLIPTFIKDPDSILNNISLVGEYLLSKVSCFELANFSLFSIEAICQICLNSHQEIVSLINAQKRVNSINQSKASVEKIFNNSFPFKMSGMINRAREGAT